MQLQDNFSLARIVDKLNDLEWRGKFLINGERLEMVRILASFYQNNTDYLGFKIPQRDFENGAHLFTGEKIRTLSGLNYVLGFEACRAMILLDGFQVEIQPIIQEVYQRAKQTCFASQDCIMGECAFSGLAYWRFLLVAAWPETEDRIRRFLKQLRQDRDGTGRWNHFPFYFTLQVLYETYLEEAQEEILYAQPACERSLPFVSLPEPYASRRKALLDTASDPITRDVQRLLPLGI